MPIFPFSWFKINLGSSGEILTDRNLMIDIINASFNVKISNTVVALIDKNICCNVPLLSWHTRTVLSLARKHWTSSLAVPSLQQSNEFSVPQSGGPVSEQLEQIQGLFIFKSKSCLVKGQVACDVGSLETYLQLLFPLRTKPFRNRRPWLHICRGPWWTS